jgi:hypothetical protein
MCARLGDKDALFAIMFLLINSVSLRFGPEDEPLLSYDEGMEITASTALAVSNKVLTLVLRQLAVQRSVVTTASAASEGLVGENEAARRRPREARRTV